MTSCHNLVEATTNASTISLSDQASELFIFDQQTQMRLYGENYMRPVSEQVTQSFAFLLILYYFLNYF